ncbi:hypothetical protein ACJX0J_036374 [Zea mays]
MYKLFNIYVNAFIDVLWILTFHFYLQNVTRNSIMRKCYLIITISAQVLCRPAHLIISQKALEHILILKMKGNHVNHTTALYNLGRQITCTRDSLASIDGTPQQKHSIKNSRISIGNKHHVLYMVGKSQLLNIWHATILELDSRTTSDFVYIRHIVCQDTNKTCFNPNITHKGQGTKRIIDYYILDTGGQQSCGNE